VNYLNTLTRDPVGTVTEFLVLIDNPDQISNISQNIQRVLGSSVHLSRAEESSGLVKSVSRLTNGVMLLLLVMLLLVVILTLNAVTSNIVQSRSAIFGILVAMGIRQTTIYSLLGIEVLVAVTLFSVLGSLGGAAIVGLFMPDGFEASIVPLKMIFGTDRVVLRIDSLDLTATVLLVLAAAAMVVLSAFVRSRTRATVELMRGL
jgi:ABC-type lipoprotein release transport system permease subunit